MACFAIFAFDRSVLRTNFYQLTKLALSFRMAPGFLPEVEYPKKPFGMFFVIGAFFWGDLWTFYFYFYLLISLGLL